MNHSRTEFGGRIRLLAAALLLAAGLQAQTTAPRPGALVADSPVVLYQLTHLYGQLAATVAQRNAADPEHAASRLLGARNFFGVSADGFQRMGMVLSPAKTQLDELSAAQARFAAGLTGANGGASVDATLQDFETQRNSILRGLPAKLRTALAPQDFTALQSFITNELLTKIQTGVINNVRPK